MEETKSEHRYTTIYLETELINRLESVFNQIVMPQNGLIHFILEHVLDDPSWIRLIKILTENRTDIIISNNYSDVDKVQVSIVNKDLATKLHRMADIAGCSIPAFIERICASFVLLFELLDTGSMAEELKRMIKSSYAKIQKLEDDSNGGNKK